MPAQAELTAHQLANCQLEVFSTCSSFGACSSINTSNSRKYNAGAHDAGAQRCANRLTRITSGCCFRQVNIRSTRVFVPRRTDPVCFGKSTSPRQGLPKRFDQVAQEAHNTSCHVELRPSLRTGGTVGRSSTDGVQLRPVSKQLIKALDAQVSEVKAVRYPHSSRADACRPRFGGRQREQTRYLRESFHGNAEIMGNAGQLVKLGTLFLLLSCLSVAILSFATQQCSSCPCQGKPRWSPKVAPSSSW